LAYFECSAPDLGSGPEAEQQLAALLEGARSAAPSLVVLDDLDALLGGGDKKGGETHARRLSSRLCRLLDGLPSAKEGDAALVIVLATSREADAVDARLRRFGRFEREISLGAPDQDARAALLERHVPARRADAIDFGSVARKCPGWAGADLVQLANAAGASCIRRDGVVQGVQQRDLEEALAKVAPSFTRSGFAKRPDVDWNLDVGGINDVREALRASILAPIRDPKRFEALGVPLPSGVLLYGPPGCGKTLVARAVAAAASANFISVKGPELLDKYVGESERAVRNLFERARASAPCIILFDEIDALAPRRGGGPLGVSTGTSSDSSGVSDRVVNQLLTELDGLEERGRVYVVAATNRPELVDPAVLRPGRVDKLLYVPLPAADDRVAILKAAARRATLAADVDLDDIGRDARAEGFSGADLAAVVRDAGLAALDAGAAALSQMHFLGALERVAPSVSREDAAAYVAADERLRARGRRS
jgi:ribosome biogenesis ATPase